ncbi:MAG: M50 family metallopeptidase [Mastigocoleus sp.]
MFLAQSFVDYSWNDIIRWLNIDTLSASDRQELYLLLMIAVITFVLWQFKLGRKIIMPYYILGVFFHEIGHAIAILMLGGRPVKVKIYPNGNGVTWSYYQSFGRFRRTIVSSAGFLGSSIVGGLLIVASRNPQITNNILIFLGVFLLVMTFIWVREWLGYGFMLMSLWGLIILAIAYGGHYRVIAFRTPPDVQKLMIQFLGIQATMINFLNIGYLFDVRRGSDIEKIQRYLLLPYWFWGIIVSILCLEIFVQSIRIAFFTSSFR